MASKLVGPDLFVGGELLVLDLVGDAGDVHQVVIVDVLADAVAAPGAAAEGRGRVQAVVHRAAEARAANLVDAVTGNIHAGRDIFNVLLGVGVDHAAVAGAFHVEVRAGDLNSVFPLVVVEQSQHGAELLLGENVVIGNALRAAEDHAGILGHRQAGHLADGGGGSADDVLVQRAVGEHGLAQDLSILLVVDDVSAGFFGILDGLGALLLGDDHVLLAGAQNAVIEGTAGDDHLDNFLQVDVAVDHDLNVALADADGRLAAGVGSLDHARAAGADAQIHSAHQAGRELHGGLGDDLDQVLGHAELFELSVHQLNSLDADALSAGMRADDDGIAALHRAGGVVHDGDDRVRGRGDGTDDADGLCDLGDLGVFIPVDDAATLLTLHAQPNGLGLVAALGDLAVVAAHAGLIDGHVGQHLGVIVHSLAHGAAGGVHLFLRIRLEFGLRHTRVCYKLL